jgi:hypothetical protein
MNNLKTYNFVNEELFKRKQKEFSFEERIDKVNDLLIRLISTAGIINSDMPNDKIGWMIDLYLKQASEVLRELNDIVIKLGRTMNQEQVNIFVKMFVEIKDKYCTTGYKLKDYGTFRNVKDYLNSITNILKYIKNFRGLDVALNDAVFDNPLVFYKNNGFVQLAHKSYVDRKKKEQIELHKDVDPLGEENWDD